jgi:hypothetical protein
MMLGYINDGHFSYCAEYLENNELDDWPSIINDYAGNNKLDS